jgi:hypothetical protein
MADTAGAIPILADKPKRGVIRYRRILPDGLYDEFDF